MSIPEASTLANAPYRNTSLYGRPSPEGIGTETESNLATYPSKVAITIPPGEPVSPAFPLADRPASRPDCPTSQRPGRAIRQRRNQQESGPCDHPGKRIPPRCTDGPRLLHPLEPYMIVAT